jgi:hypothetical protein
MQKKLTLLLSFILITIFALPESKAASMPASEIRQFYEELHLQNEVSYKAFQQAIVGYCKIKVKKPVLTLIDFSKASTEERLYVIDMEKKTVLFKSHVAHGKNSGGNYATSFSNERGSNQSSLGFFLTENTYQGKNGLSLIINGLEKGINDRAKMRAVVIHGADYANPKQAKILGRLGRSFGCPALPRGLAQPIINTIKDGSLLYIYSESHNEEYLKNSSLIG